MAQKFSWDDMADVDESPPPKSGGKGAKFDWDSLPDHPDSSFDPKAAVQGFGNMATAGYIPEMTGAAGKTIPNPGSDVDAKLKAQGFKIQQPDFNGATTDDSRAQQAQMASDSPYSYYGGGVAGAVASAPAFGAALKGLSVAKVIPALPKVAALGEGVVGAAGPDFAARMANLGARSFQAAKEGAVIGAVANPNTRVGDSGFNVGQRLLDAGGGAAISSVLPVAGDAIKGTFNAAKNSVGWTGVKALSSAGGVSPANIKEYLNFSDRINSSPTVADAKNISDEFVGKLASDVENKKISVDQANQALAAHKQDVALKWGDDVGAATQDLSDARSDYREAKSQSANKVSQDTYAVKQALGDAQTKLDTEHGQFVQGLKDQTAPTQLAPEAVEAVNNLKTKVTDASSDAFDALANSGASMPKKTLLGTIDSHMNDLMIQGKAAVGGQAEQALNSLQKLKGQISSLGDDLSMPDLKRIVQGLGKDISWTNGAGEFADAASQQKMGIRSSIDTFLKTNVPEYKKLMEPLAQSSKLLSQVSGQYGTPQKAFSRIAGIANKSPEDQQLLYRLGQETGQDFQGPVEQHLRAQALLKDPAALQAIKQSHPSYGDVQSLEAQLAERQKPGFSSGKVDFAMDGSPEARRLALTQVQADQFTTRARTENMNAAVTTSPQAKAVGAAQAALEQSQEKLAPFKSLAPNGSDQTAVQQKLEALGKGGNIELEGMFKRLGQLTDTDFVQAMKDRHVLAAFDKGATNGSRNAVRFGSAGGAIGSLIAGLPGYAVGNAAGSSIGGVIDQWGPAITKKILNGVIAVSKNPAVSTISSLDLPPEIKANMVTSLKSYLSRDAAQTVPRALPAAAQNQSKVNRSPAVGEDKWAQQGIQSLGISDRAMTQKLLSDPKAKKLLIQASDLKPGSKAMKKIMDQINTGWGSQ